MSELHLFMRYWTVISILIVSAYVIPLILFARWDAKLRRIENGVYEPDKQVLDALVDLNKLMNDKIIKTNKEDEKQ